MNKQSDQLEAACEVAREIANSMSEAGMSPSVISCALWRTAAQVIGTVAPYDAIDPLIDDAARLMKTEAYSIYQFAAEFRKAEESKQTDHKPH
ncbi:hypothetical protein I6H96_02540 [Brucella anthropi]|uniref:Uncharacterized protein n=1 Tax=Brucella anthropi (strain ATCC 49188 / DSM 6882 / CCUG 24695 / JCM 21032 / LMG 3331 / NBRC 15819 / NCTC 12168 / Alc 37) TaxID=439375 RepID=A6WZ29_BRUA4|nr:hypothetical protein [Brucella anthropi]ABS14233.1 hypothetical protein Oant_1517 [Brucella anthropi ATCC 49188]NKC48122.1 hypothetical protein [Brucella anthropi ATCC 49188]QQC25760.1 hypothetical protein I6H96_02540 [Brucella anthropi]SUA65524.1 Uncharacterised protein [Brucella anthropi]